jgi:DNA-binding transcriptional MerR regulator
MRLPLKRKAIDHWPATVSTVAEHFNLSASMVRYLCAIGVCKPATDSRGRRLFLQPDVEQLAEYRRMNGKK